MLVLSQVQAMLNSRHASALEQGLISSDSLKFNYSATGIAKPIISVGRVHLKLVPSRVGMELSLEIPPGTRSSTLQSL